MVKVALTGLGFMGKTHIAIYSRLANAEVVAVCDSNAEAWDQAAEGSGNIETDIGSIDETNISRYTDFDAMLSDGGFDFVDLCVPTDLHAPYSLKALDAGYHVFCEKPMCLTVEDAERVIARVDETGRLYSVGQCLRYWPAYSEIKNIIEGGRYGNVRYAELARFSLRPEWSRKSWILDSRQSGNAALDLHVHDVDMILHLFGQPEAVRSSGVRDEDGSFSHISTLYTFPDKVVTSTGGWICPPSFGFNMRGYIVLENGSIELDFSKQPVLKVYPGDAEAFAPELAEEDGYFYELEDFVKGIEKGRLSGLVTARSAADAVRMCLAEIRSARKAADVSFH